jgi:intracellular septation protein
MSKKQNPNLPPPFLEFLKGVNLRCGFFFLIHAAIATWAALKWSTQAWALLKGLGVTLSFILYMVLEVLIFRKKLKSDL